LPMQIGGALPSSGTYGTTASRVCGRMSTQILSKRSGGRLTLEVLSAPFAENV
jgi:hypothetical protein